MDHEAFQAWLAEVDALSPRQREEATRVLTEPASLEAVVALLEARVDEARRCPHCATEGAVIRGRSNGLKRYCCKGCGKTFNALTGTPLARLRKKELWAAFAEGLGEGDTVKGAAERCGVADSTSFRWRHRFLAAVKAGSIKLKGIVEADETYVLTSRKGARKLDRKPRKRGGVARKRGLSKEQVPIMVAADRSGTTFTHVLPDTTAATIRTRLETLIEPDALLVTDGAPFFPPCARALGLTHKPLDHKAGERGGVAQKRGLSKEQVPILVAADRSGTTLTRVLPDTTAATIKPHLETSIEPDALLGTHTALRSSRPVLGPWASPTNRSTTKPANAAAATSISTLSTSATATPAWRT